MAYFDNLFTGSKSSSPSTSGGRYFSNLTFSTPKKTTPSVTPTPKVNVNKTITIGGLTFDSNAKQPTQSAQFSNIYKALTSPPPPKKVDVSSQLQLKPEQKKLDNKQIQQVKPVTLPDGRVIQPSVLTAAPPKKEEKPNVFTLARRFIDSIFGISPEERARMDLNDQIARAQNAYYLKTTFPDLTEGFSLVDLTKKGGNPFRESAMEQAGRQAMERVGINTTPNNKQFTDLMFALSLPVSLGAGAARLAPSVLSQIRLLGKFTAVSLAFDTAFQKLTGKHSVSELLPEGTPMPITIAVDAVEFLGKGVLAHGVRPGKMLDVFTKETINKYNLPKKFTLNSTQVNDIVKGGKLTTAEQKRAFQDLGLTEKQIQSALKNGIKIEVPSANVARVVDRSYWADIKKSFRIEPVTGEKVAPRGTITVRETTSSQLSSTSQFRNIQITHGTNRPITEVRQTGLHLSRNASENLGKAVYFSDSKLGSDAFGSGQVSINTKGLRLKSFPTLTEQEAFVKNQGVKSLADAIRKEGKYDGFILPNADRRVGNTFGITNLDKVNRLIQTKEASLRSAKAVKPQPTGGTTPSKIAKSIERKSIEQELTKGFENLAGYDKITIKEQAAMAAKVMKDLGLARRIIRGEEPLPKGLRGTALITAAEARIKATGDAKLAYELANSPLVSRTSLAAQELRLAAERVPDSLTIRMRELKSLREAAVEKRTGKSVNESVKMEVGKIKKATEKTAPKKQDWSSFIKSIEC